MKREEFEKIKKQLSRGDKIQVEYRCNWHRGMGHWQKNNKVVVGEFLCIDEAGNCIILLFQGEYKHISYRGIAKIEVAKT